MWFTLDTSRILCDPADLYQSKTDDLASKKKPAPLGANIGFDIPSNMEVLFHQTNGTLQIKFFYYAGGSEQQEQLALRTAVAEVGKNSKRLFSISAKSISSLRQGINELVLGCAKPRTELNLRSCLIATQVYEKDFKHLLVFDIMEVSPGQKLEKIFMSFDIETLENFQGLLESSKNLKLTSIEQVISVLEMFLNDKKN
jgi:hypothetical protein